MPCHIYIFGIKKFINDKKKLQYPSWNGDKNVALISRIVHNLICIVGCNRIIKFHQNNNVKKKQKMKEVHNLSWVK